MNWWLSSVRPVLKVAGLCHPNGNISFNASQPIVIWQMYSVLELGFTCIVVTIQQHEKLLSHQMLSNLYFPIELQIAIFNLDLRKHFAHRKIKKLVFPILSCCVCHRTVNIGYTVILPHWQIGDVIFTMCIFSMYLFTLLWGVGSLSITNRTSSDSRSFPLFGKLLAQLKLLILGKS